MRTTFLLVVSLALVVASTGCNECSFWERCDGNILQLCGSGPDHIVGRKIRSFPCEAPNPACVEVDEHAFCAAEPLQECDDSHEPYCDGVMLQRCRVSDEQGYVVQQDCAEGSEDGGVGNCLDSADGGVRCE